MLEERTLNAEFKLSGVDTLNKNPFYRMEKSERELK